MLAVRDLRKSYGRVVAVDGASFSVEPGQLVGLLPWQLALRSPEGAKQYVSVKGTRKMLEARRYYRSLRARQV